MEIICKNEVMHSKTWHWKLRHVCDDRVGRAKDDGRHGQDSGAGKARNKGQRGVGIWHGVRHGRPGYTEGMGSLATFFGQGHPRGHMIDC